MIGTRPTGYSLHKLLHLLLVRVQVDSLMRNSIYIMGTTVVTAGLGYLYWIVAAHLYSTHAIGLASALIGAMTLASLLSNLGIGSAFVQVLPQRIAGRQWSLTLNAGMLAGALSALLAGGIAVVILPLVSPELAMDLHRASYAIAFVAGVMLFTLATLLDQMFVAERSAGKMLLRNTAFAVLKIPLLLIPLLFAHANVLGLFASWILAGGISLFASVLLLVPRLGRFYSPTVRGLGVQMRSMLSLLAGHHLINLGGMLPMYLLPIFVTVRLSATDNAYFYTTYMIGSIFFMISPAVATSLYAETAHNLQCMMQKTRASILLICLLLGPAMLFALLAGHTILALFGPGYAQHGQTLLVVLVIAAIPDAITSVYTSILRARNHLRLAASLNIGMALLTLALAWVLLPQMGIVGAGVAWLLAQSCGSIAVLLYASMRTLYHSWL